MAVVTATAAALAIAGCGQPITSRQARSGRTPAVTPEPAVATAPGAASLESLAAAAQNLREPRRSIVETTLAMVGASAGELDCSSFAQHVYRLCGAGVPRTVEGQFASGRNVPSSDLQPGDLVFFSFSHGVADHVGIYAGSGSFAHVSAASRRVRLESLADPSFARTSVGARRFLPSG
jgi:cell wall-associated NlpC family hydrolase